ncbi:hypothetical protein AmDm5_0816 [Acetobacter malorum]|nr:hypothetical protein AmDm5_0816 [Acetobacter malorum]
MRSFSSFSRECERVSFQNRPRTKTGRFAISAAWLLNTARHNVPCAGYFRREKEA